MKRILIVDDEPAILEILRTVFEDSSFAVETCGTAEDALSRLRREIFDILLTDKNLPGMSGVELIAKVRANNDRLPIVMMTAFATAQSVKETMHLGIDAYLEKPFTDVFAVAKLAIEILKKPRHVPPPAPKSRLANTLGPVVQVLVASPDATLLGKAASPIDEGQAKVSFAATYDEIIAEFANAEPHILVLDADGYPPDPSLVLEKIVAFAPSAMTVVVAENDLPVGVLRRLVDLRAAGVFDKRFDETYRSGMNALIQRVKLRS